MRVNRAPDWARDSIDHFFDVALNRLAMIPGVRELAMSDCPPVNPGCGTQREAMLASRTPGVESGPVVGVHWITPTWTTVMVFHCCVAACSIDTTTDIRERSCS